MAITLRGNADSDFSNGIDSDGNIEGDIFIGTTADDGADSSAFVTRQGGGNNFQVTGGGTVRIGGIIPGDPNILLNADGSAEFANTVRINDPNNATAADREGVTIGQAGNVSIFTQAGANSGTQVFQIFDTNANNRCNITENGSASFDGTVNCGTATSNTLHLIRGARNNNNGILQVNNASLTAEAPAASFITGTNSVATTNSILTFFSNGGGGGQGRINANGVDACAFGSLSDRRLKTDISELPSQWDNIKALKPSQYKYLSDLEAGTQVGFIAQEFQEVYPEAVATAKMPVPVAERSDPEVEETVDRLMLTGWSKTEAYLVKALQEAMARIETLESRLSTLEGGNT